MRPINPPPQTFTVYVQILPDGDSLPHPRCWTPWYAATSVQDTSAMAAHKHLRERGGVAPGETYTFRVVAYTDGMIEATGKVSNGNPSVMLSTSFSASHAAQRPAPEPRKAVIAA